jgi:hypothetical protein
MDETMNAQEKVDVGLQKLESGKILSHRAGFGHNPLSFLTMHFHQSNLLGQVIIWEGRAGLEFF